MPDKEFKIKIGTEGDPSGAKEVGKAVEEVNVEVEKLDDAKPPLTPDDVRPAVGSLSALRDELQRLERELSDVPVGSNAFLDLADKVKVAQRQLGEAEAQSRRLAGTVGRGGNAGAAVLEFSRAFEDAQYGIRGVLNNIPTLIAMVGGGAGLAGVISVAAVAGTQLWERLSNSESAEDAVDAVADAAEKLATKLKALRDRRKEIEQIPTTDLGAALKEETTALKLQTEGFRQNIQALKDRITAAGALDAIFTQGALGDIDRALGDGTISPDEAARRRTTIEEGSKQRELQRIEELSKLDDAVALEAKAAAQRELQLAEFKKRAADERLREAEAEEARLKAALARRNEIDTLRAQLDAAEETLLHHGIDGRSREDAERLRNSSTVVPGDLTGGAASANLREWNEMIAQNIETVAAASERLSELQSGGSPAGQETLAKQTSDLLTNLEKLREAVGEAAKEITDKTANLQIVTQSSDAALNRSAEQNQNREDQGAANRQLELQQQLTGLDQRAGEEVGKLLDQILSLIGGAANQPAVTERAGQLRDLISNGLQGGESDQARQLLLQLVSKIDSGNKDRGVAYQQIISTFDTVVAAQKSFQSQLDEVKRQIRTNTRAGGQGQQNF